MSDAAQYLLAREAALRFSLSRDYVTRLAREGRIEGKRIKNSWHVSEESLRRFCAEQDQVQAERRQALADTRRREYRGEDVTPKHAEVVSSMRAAVGRLAGKKSLTHHIRTAPLYAMHPALDLMHRATALVGALAIVVGAYAFLYPESLYLAGNIVKSVAGAAASLGTH